MKVADDRLRKVLGLSQMSFHSVNHRSRSPTCRSRRIRQARRRHDIFVDNFSFAPAVAPCPSARRSPGPTATTSAHRRQHGAEIQVAGARHRRAVLAPLRRAGHLQVFLLAPSQDDRPGRGRVRAMRNVDGAERRCGGRADGSGTAAADRPVRSSHCEQICVRALDDSGGSRRTRAARGPIAGRGPWLSTPAMHIEAHLPKDG